ncbi:unnamed protein product, partial [Prorocentrum cordatum]
RNPSVWTTEAAAAAMMAATAAAAAPLAAAATAPASGECNAWGEPRPVAQAGRGRQQRDALPRRARRRSRRPARGMPRLSSDASSWLRPAGGGGGGAPAEAAARGHRPRHRGGRARPAAPSLGGAPGRGSDGGQVEPSVSGSSEASALPGAPRGSAGGEAPEGSQSAGASSAAPGDGLRHDGCGSWGAFPHPGGW